MSYLYGDSTPSKLEVNYIEFLRDAVEFCVQVLLADQRVAQGRTQTRTLEHATVAEVERLQKLGPLVAKAFEGTPLGAADSATARCAAAIARSANDLVRAEAITDAGRPGCRDRQARRAGGAGARRHASRRSRRCVVKHDLPDTAVDVHLAITGGVRYAGRARVKTGFGLDAVFDLEVPAGNLFERVVRVDRLVERLDIQAPEVGGWLHKEVKQRTQHLEKHHVAELSLGAAGATVKLRVARRRDRPGLRRHLREGGATGAPGARRAAGRDEPSSRSTSRRTTPRSCSPFTASWRRRRRGAEPRTAGASSRRGSTAR